MELDVGRHRGRAGGGVGEGGGRAARERRAAGTGGVGVEGPFQRVDMGGAAGAHVPEVHRAEFRRAGELEVIGAGEGAADVKAVDVVGRPVVVNRIRRHAADGDERRRRQGDERETQFR